MQKMEEILEFDQTKLQKQSAATTADTSKESLTSSNKSEDKIEEEN